MKLFKNLRTSQASFWQNILQSRLTLLVMKNNLILLAIVCLATHSLNAQTKLFLDNKSMGNIEQIADQASGLVWLNSNKDLWTHNDYWGDRNINEKNKLFKIEVPIGSGTPGKEIKITRQITVNEPGATSKIDWEDLTKDESNNVYIGNFGDCLNTCHPNKILKISNPNNLGNSVTPQIIHFQYPKKPGISGHTAQVVSNTEAMFFYNGFLYLVSKQIRHDYNEYKKDGYTYMFKIPASTNSAANPHQATLVGSFKTKVNNADNASQWRVTGADISPDKKSVVLLCQARIFVFSCFNNDQFLSGEYQYGDLYKDNSISNLQLEGITYFDNDEVYISQDGGATRLFKLNIGGIIQDNCNNNNNNNNCNLIKNSLFDNGDAYWNNPYYFSTTNASMDTKWNSAFFDIVNGGSKIWHIQLSQKNIPLVQGRRYRVKFSAYSDKPKTIYSKLSNHNDQVKYGQKYFDIVKEWKQYVFEFTMNEGSDSNARLNFAIGGNNTNVIFDNIKVEELNCGSVETCNQKISNGQFDTNVNNFDLNKFNSDANWYHNSGGKYASIKITNGTTDRWRIQFIQKNIALSKGETYKVRFTAKADANKNIYAKVSNANDTEAIGFKDFTITNTWKQYEFTFTMNKSTATNYRLNFGIGGNNTAIRFDNVSILKSSCNNQYKLENNLEDEHAQKFVINYQNPFDTSLQLELNDQIQEEMTLFLYDSFGRLVFEEHVKSKSQIEIPTDHLVSGLYILKVSHGFGFESQSYKLVKH